MKNTITIDLADAVRLELGSDTTHIPATVDIAELFEFSAIGDHELDLDNLLAKENKVALIWSVEDVKSRRPDLNDDQAWEILIEARDDFLRDRCHLDFIESTSEGRHPRGEEAKHRLRERAVTLLRQIEALPAIRLDPAAYGKVAAHLDDAEEAVRKNGGAQ